MNNPNLRSEKTPVLKVNQPGGVFYICVLRAELLCALCAGLRVSPNRGPYCKGSNIENDKEAERLISSLTESSFAKEVIEAQTEAYEEDDPYQRILDQARSSAIASYLKEEDAILPNSVILAAREEVQVEVSPDFKEIVFSWDITDTPVPFNIIDGQHRIEGLRILLDEQPATFKDFGVAVTILLDLPFFAQAELFATINGQQKKVNKSQIYDLLGYKPISSAKFKRDLYFGSLAVYRFCHHAVKVLNTSTKSPWKGYLKMRGSGEGIITQAAFVDHLEYYLTAKQGREEMRRLPVLYPFLKTSDLIGLSRLLVMYFIGVQQSKKQFWVNSDTLRSSLFGKTNGVAVLFSVLHDLICYFDGPENVTIKAVADLWGKVDDRLLSPPFEGGSKVLQSRLTSQVLTCMFGPQHEAVLKGKVDNMRTELKKVGAIL